MRTENNNYENDIFTVICSCMVEIEKCTSLFCNKKIELTKLPTSYWRFAQITKDMVITPFSFSISQILHLFIDRYFYDPQKNKISQKYFLSPIKQSS